MEELKHWQPVQKKIKQLIPYERNPRTITEKRFNKLKEIITEQGFRSPICLDNDNQILAGHQRMRALIDLGFGDEVVWCMVPPPNLELTKELIKKIIVQDNLSWGEFDMDILAADYEVMELVEMGFEELESFEEKEADQDIEEDEAPEPEENPVAKLGDVWLLGEHRLMCGDSTKIDDVEKLMSGEKADMVFTDPPYNVGYQYNSYDDNKSAKEYEQFCSDWLSNLSSTVSKRAIITPGKQNLGLWYRLTEITDIGIWIKKNAMSGGKISHLNCFEPIIFIGKFDRTSRANDLFEFNNKHQKDILKEHTCPKSMDLMVDIIKCYTKKAELVADVFLGSGSTLIACEQTNRKCYGMELDPKYCDVIIKRWQNLTEKDAVLEATKETYNKIKNQDAKRK